MSTTTILTLVTPETAPALLTATWAQAMRGQGLSERTVAERQRVIAQLARDTGTDPAAPVADGNDSRAAPASSPGTAAGSVRAAR